MKISVKQPSPTYVLELSAEEIGALERAVALVSLSDLPRHHHAANQSNYDALKPYRDIEEVV